MMASAEALMSARPEPVEGLPWLLWTGKGKGFDKLSPNGIFYLGGTD